MKVQYCTSVEVAQVLTRKQVISLLSKKIEEIIKEDPGAAGAVFDHRVAIAFMVNLDMTIDDILDRFHINFTEQDVLDEIKTNPDDKEKEVAFELERKELIAQFKGGSSSVVRNTGTYVGGMPETAVFGGYESLGFHWSMSALKKKYGRK